MNEEAQTLYVGNLASEVSEDLLYELFMQAGPVETIKIPFDKSTQKPKSFGFVCYKDEISVPYAIYLLNNTSFLGRNIVVQSRRPGDNLPPIDCVGVHSLDPSFSQNSEMDKTSISDAKYPLMHNNKQGLLQFQQESYMPAVNISNANTSYARHNSGYQMFGSYVPPTVDTASMNLFKHSYPNQNKQYGNDRYSEANGYRNNSPQNRYSADNGNRNSSREDRKYGHQSNHQHYDRRHGDNRTYSNGGSNGMQNRISYDRNDNNSSHRKSHNDSPNSRPYSNNRYYNSPNAYNGGY